MNWKQRFLCMLLMGASVCASIHVHAQQNNWQILFNGKNLDGWQQLNGKHIWEVSNGMIVGTTVPGEPNGFLCTVKEYGDFILELEVSIDTLMNNSGVQFRSLSYPGYDNGRLHGYQMEVDPKPQQWSGAIYEEGGSRGWLYAGDELSAAAKKSFRRDTKNGYQWNKYRIECVGTTIRTWVNGVPAAHLIDDKFLRGYIGLQLHANQANDPPGSYKIRFRNIRVQTGNLELSPWDDTFVVNLLPNNLSTQEEENGYRLLWDGRTENGWRGPGNAEFPHSNWSYKNGELRVVNANDTQPGEPDIITEKKYGPFELKFDFKLSGRGNSGVGYFVNESDDNSSLRTSSLEYQIVGDSAPGIPGSLTGIMEAKRISIRTGMWYRAVIKVGSDNHVEHWLNGNKVLEYKRGSAEFRDSVSRSRYRDLKKFGMNPRGNLLLRNSGGAVSFRSLKIKDLSNPAPKNTGVKSPELFIRHDRDSGMIFIYRSAKNNAPIIVQNAKQNERPFIHPIVAPDGRGVLTQYRPPHHPHQTGLFWGFKRVNERDFFINWQRDYWRKVSDSVIKSKGQSVQWQTVYDLLDEKGMVCLSETTDWTIQIKDGSYLIDLVWKGVAKTDITFGKFYVGGLFLRMPWFKGIAGEVINANGQRNLEAEGQKALWTDVGMAIEGRDDWAHVAILDHPDNKSFPVAWRVDNELGVGPSRQIAGDWKLSKGSTEVVRYRLIVYTGEFNHDKLMKHWREFCCVN